MKGQITKRPLNVIPDGQEAWLSYDDYQDLEAIFETIDLPSAETKIKNPNAFSIPNDLYQTGADDQDSADGLTHAKRLPCF